MSNYYSIVTADEALPCSEAEAAHISHLLQTHDAESDEACGFTFEYVGGSGGFLFAEESGHEEFLPDGVLDAIAELIRRAGRPYLECGVAFSASRLLPGSHGGTAFRIQPDGTIVNPTVTWP